MSYVSVDVFYFLYYSGDTVDHYPRWWVLDYSVEYITEIIAHWIICLMYMRVDIETRVLFSQTSLTSGDAEAKMNMILRRKKQMRIMTYIFTFAAFICGLAVYWFWFDPDPTPVAYWVSQILPLVLQWTFLVLWGVSLYKLNKHS